MGNFILLENNVFIKDSCIKTKVHNTIENFSSFEEAQKDLIDKLVNDCFTGEEKYRKEITESNMKNPFLYEDDYALISCAYNSSGEISGAFIYSFDSKEDAIGDVTKFTIYEI